MLPYDARRCPRTLCDNGALQHHRRIVGSCAQRVSGATLWPIPASIGGRMKCSVLVCQASVQSLDISTGKLGACRVYHNCAETPLRRATIPGGGRLQRRQDLPDDAFFVPSDEDLAGVSEHYRNGFFDHRNFFLSPCPIAG